VEVAVVSSGTATLDIETSLASQIDQFMVPPCLQGGKCC